MRRFINLDLQIMTQTILNALQVLRAGGVILYPTDTVWGIGCDATNPVAVQRVLDIKHSVDKKGMIVLVDSINSVARYFNNVPPVAWDLLECADKPLTLILPNAVGVAPLLIPQEGTLAVRVPKHDFCQQLLTRFGKPLVSTSANISGNPTPHSFDTIDTAIRDAVDYVVEPRWEGTPTGKPSSIIQLGSGGEVAILRP